MTRRDPANRFRIYSGFRLDGTAVVQRVDLDGKRTRLNPRFDIMNHSPCGFEWGYEGSGPAQLALAILCDATGDDALALSIYQDFKRQIVGHFTDRWELQAGDVADFAKSLGIAKAERIERAQSK